MSPLPSPRTEPAGLARPCARAPEQEPGGASACGVTADTYVEAALPSQRKGFSPCRRAVVLGCRYFSENAGTGLHSCCCTPGAPREPWFLPTWPCVAAPVGALDAAASGPAFPAGTFHLQTGREDWASVGPRRGVGEDKRVVWPGTAGPWTVEVPHWPVRWVWAEGVLSLTVDSADGGGGVPGPGVNPAGRWDPSVRRGLCRRGYGPWLHSPGEGAAPVSGSPGHTPAFQRGWLLVAGSALTGLCVRPLGTACARATPSAVMAVLQGMGAPLTQGGD